MIDPQHYRNKGASFLKGSDKGKIDKAIKSLDKIEEEEPGVDIPSEDIQEILDQFWKLYNSGVTAFFQFYSKRKNKRKILRYINIKCDRNDKVIVSSEALVDFLELYREDDSEISLFHLILALLRSWNYLIPDNEKFKLFTDLLSDKLQVSNNLRLSKSQLYLESREFILSKNGPVLFVEEMINQEFSIDQMIKKTGLRLRGTSYFTYIIDRLFSHYLKHKEYDKAWAIIKDLDEPNYSVAQRKRMISLFIIEVDKHNFGQYREGIQDIAVRLIGDPGNRSYWSVWQGGNQEDKKTIDKAWRICNYWMLSAFINILFQKVIDSEERRLYWLSKIKQISSVKIYASNYIKGTLLADDRLKPYVSKRFHRVYDDEAAVVIGFTNYEFVEFSGTGAIYCYLRQNKRIDNRRVENSADLKITNMPMACAVNTRYRSDEKVNYNGNAYYLNNEGRIVHMGTAATIQAQRIVRKASWMIRTDLFIKQYVR